jgi:hypothetical protein
MLKAGIQAGIARLAIQRADGACVPVSLLPRPAASEGRLLVRRIGRLGEDGDHRLEPLPLTV